MDKRDVFIAFADFAECYSDLLPPQEKPETHRRLIELRKALRILNNSSLPGIYPNFMVTGRDDVIELNPEQIDAVFGMAKRFKREHDFKRIVIGDREYVYYSNRSKVLAIEIVRKLGICHANLHSRGLITDEISYHMPYDMSDLERPINRQRLEMLGIEARFHANRIVCV